MNCIRLALFFGAMFSLQNLPGQSFGELQLRFDSLYNAQKIPEATAVGEAMRAMVATSGTRDSVVFAKRMLILAGIYRVRREIPRSGELYRLVADLCR